MKGVFTQYYSVYDRKTDQPVIIHGTAPECAKAMGVTRNTFYHYVTRNNTGFMPCKYEIFVDDPEEDEEDGEA